MVFCPAQVTYVVSYCTLTSVLCRNEAPAVTLEVLKSLASVRRFDMAVMFMSSLEKKGGVSLISCYRRLILSLYLLLPDVSSYQSLLYYFFLPQCLKNCLTSFTKLTCKDHVLRPYRRSTACDPWI